MRRVWAVHTVPVAAGRAQQGPRTVASGAVGEVAEAVVDAVIRRHVVAAAPPEVLAEERRAA